MSISSEINRISGNVSDAFDAVAEKGGTVGNNRNSNRLASAIRSIPSGEGGGGGGSERFIINAECSVDDFWSGAADITLETGSFADALDAMYAGQDVVLQLAVVEEAPGEDPIITDAFLIPLTHASETELAGTTTVRLGELLFTVSVNLFDDDTVVVVSAATDKLMLTGEVRELEDGDEAELAGLPYASLVQSISSLRTQLGAFGIYALDDANIDFSMLQDAFYAGVPVYFGAVFETLDAFVPMSVGLYGEHTIVLSGTVSAYIAAFIFDIVVTENNGIVIVAYMRQGGLSV